MKNSRLQYFPISIFSIILGLSGFTIAFQKSEEILNFPLNVSNYLMGLTFLLALIFGLVYMLKTITYFPEVKHDFNHPIKMNFTPTIFIVFLMASILMLPVNILISKLMWIIGTIGQAFIFLYIISKWMHNPNIEIHHFNPAWFIPAVGNILIPVTGVAHFNLEISWFFFGLGFLFWIILLIIFYNRIFFHHPLPEKLLPTLFLLIAPPAVGFISYVKLTHNFKKIKFYLSWWAYSFPITAFSTASILFYHKTHINFYKYTAIGSLGFATILIGFLLVRTIIAIFINKEICVED